MFYFEDEPHDDGSFVHVAVAKAAVRMEISQVYPAFFIGRRVSGHKRGLVVSIRYADISSGTCISDQISTAVRRIEASHTRPQSHAARVKRANFIADLID